MSETPEYRAEKELFHFEEQLRGLPQLRLGVDGLAAAGKGTLNLSLQSRLSLMELPTGDMYRALTWWLLNNHPEGVAHLDDTQLKEALQGFDIQFHFEKAQGTRQILVPNKMEAQQIDISAHLQDPRIGEQVSAIAKRNPVRDILETKQRALVEWSPKIVAEGRDMWKILQGVDGVTLLYLYADDEMLIAREIDRHYKLGRTITPEKARELTIERNITDNTRTRGQLLLPHQVLSGGDHQDAYNFIVDTSRLTPEIVYQTVVRLLHTHYFPQKG